MLFLCFIFQFVFLSFWMLFLYNRELIYPKALDAIFPVWLNHAMVSEEKLSEYRKAIASLLRSPKCLVYVSKLLLNLQHPVHSSLSILSRFI